MAAGADHVMTLLYDPPPYESLGTLVLELYEVVPFGSDTLWDTMLVSMGTDFSVPTAPSFSSVFATPDSITFTLTSSDTRSGIYGFEFFSWYQATGDAQYDGLWLASAWPTGMARTIVVNGLSPNTQYTVAARAFDNLRNISSQASSNISTPPLCTSFTSPRPLSTRSRGRFPGRHADGRAIRVSGGSWSASDTVAWLSETPTSGTGPGSVTVSWTQNTSGTRSGVVTIAAKTFTVNQGTAAPAVTTTAATWVGRTSATLNASVNPKGWRRRSTTTTG